MPDVQRKAYTLPEFAEAYRLSLSSVKNLVSAGELTKTYLTPGKPVITFEEAERFEKSRPSARGI